MKTILYCTGFGERVEIYRYVHGKFFTNMQQTNWTSGITAGEEK